MYFAKLFTKYLHLVCLIGILLHIQIITAKLQPVVSHRNSIFSDLSMYQDFEGEKCNFLSIIFHCICNIFHIAEQRLRKAHSKKEPFPFFKTGYSDPICEIESPTAIRNGVFHPSTGCYGVFPIIKF